MARVLTKKKTEFPPVHGRNGIEEETEFFADQTEEQFRPNEDSDPNDEWEEEVSASVNSPIQEDNEHLEPSRSASPKEILETVRIPKDRRVPGPDGILNTALKNLPTRGISSMVNLTNAITGLRHFPKRRKNADMVMIPKRGKDLRFPQNYRSIGLLPTMGETVERIIKGRLGTCTEDQQQILPKHQFAFWERLGTELRALRVVDKIKGGFQEKYLTEAVLLDGPGRMASYTS